jgi:hypothetical protein
VHFTNQKNAPLLFSTLLGTPPSLVVCRLRNTKLNIFDSGYSVLPDSSIDYRRILSECPLIALPGQGPVRVATRALLDALHDSSWQLRYVLLWIALEALFAPPGGGEATFRLTSRLAFFLKGPTPEGRALFRRAKNTDYSIRSDIVHGMRERDIKDSHEVMATAEEWVRLSLNKILSDPKLTDLFNGKGQDEWLEEMIFGPKA